MLTEKECFLADSTERRDMDMLSLFSRGMPLTIICALFRKKQKEAVSEMCRAYHDLKTKKYFRKFPEF